MRFAVFSTIFATTAKQTSCFLFGFTRQKKSEKNIWTCKPLSESRVSYANIHFGSVLFTEMETCVNLPENVKLNELFEDSETEYQEPTFDCYLNDVHETTISPNRVKAVKDESCRKASEIRARLQAGILQVQN